MDGSELNDSVLSQPAPEPGDEATREAARALDRDLKIAPCACEDHRARPLPGRAK
jgi:hypothetical protein